MKQLRNMLGIVFCGSTITVSDVERDGDTFVLKKSAVYTLPQGVTLENISAEKVDFKAFLKENGFRSKKAIIGIPAKYTLSTRLQIPPVKDPQMRYDTIRMNLERKMEVDLSEISFDYDDRQDAPEGAFLVVMALKKILSEIRELLQAVKIAPVQVINTSLGLDLVTSSAVACNIVEYPESLEVCLFQNAALTAVQHLPKPLDKPMDAELAQKVIRQVDRTLWAASGKSETVDYYLWTRQGKDYSQDDSLRQIFKNIRCRTLTASSETLLGDLAAELAGGVILDQTTSINLLNGRHIEKKPAISSQGIWKIAAGVAVVLILIGAFIFNWRSDQNQITFLTEQLKSMQANVDAANEMIDQVGYARQWFQQSPEYLEILRELSMAFPENGDIWLTSLAVADDFHQVLTGRTVREEAILDVVDTLQSNPMFDDVKILHIRKMGKGSEIMTFAIDLQQQEGI